MTRDFECETPKLQKLIQTKKVKLELTLEELDFLHCCIYSYQDRGPVGDGWASKQLAKLRETIAELWRKEYLNISIHR